MKRTKIFCTLVLAMTFFGRLSAQSDGKEQLIVPLSEPGKPCKVKASLLYGSIRVVSYEGKEIVIDVEGDKRHEPSTSGSGMRRIGGGSGADVSAQEDNNSVVIDAGVSQISSLTIKVPQGGCDLNLSAVNNGDITVNNVKGQLEVENVNGWINLEGISGSVVANTVNGDLTVSFRSVDPHAAMAFSTLNGKVEVSFPADIKANLKLKAEQGDIYTDFDIEAAKGAPNVNKNSEGHMYRINIDDWVYGKVNGGGPEMMMKTTNGSVYVTKAK